MGSRDPGKPIEGDGEKREGKTKGEEGGGRLAIKAAAADPSAGPSRLLAGSKERRKRRGERKGKEVERCAH